MKRKLSGRVLICFFEEKNRNYGRLDGEYKLKYIQSNIMHIDFISLFLPNT